MSKDWRRKWQTTSAFLPGKFHGQWSLVGYSPCGHKELDITRWLNTHTHTHTERCLRRAGIQWWLYHLYKFSLDSNSRLAFTESALPISSLPTADHGTLQPPQSHELIPYSKYKYIYIKRLKQNLFILFPCR